jgi:metal-responsive CopG/Arc/MetJ family transcriptional regulator
MAAKPVQISLEPELLRRIDADPETREKGRSAFIRAAVELYLKARDRRTVDDAIFRAYSARADEMTLEIADLIGEQSWPKE